MTLPEELAPDQTLLAQAAPEGDQRFLVVAKGHQNLLGQLEALVGDFGWVRVIEERRDDPTLLPRTGREGSVHLGEERQP